MGITGIYLEAADCPEEIGTSSRMKRSLTTGSFNLNLYHLTRLKMEKVYSLNFLILTEDYKLSYRTGVNCT
jgi:hypothetical protein